MRFKCILILLLSPSFTNRSCSTALYHVCGVHWWKGYLIGLLRLGFNRSIDWPLVRSVTTKVYNRAARVRKNERMVRTVQRRKVGMT
jgi:hypothetical protein